MYCKEQYGYDITINDLCSNAPSDELNVIDPNIRNEILQCYLKDNYNNYLAETSKHCVGREYEEVLYHCMTYYKMSYETEAQLRLQGKPKTPDALFTIPMGVNINGEWEIVHWIDSKGMQDLIVSYNISYCIV